MPDHRSEDAALPMCPKTYEQIGRRTNWNMDNGDFNLPGDGHRCHPIMYPVVIRKLPDKHISPPSLQSGRNSYSTLAAYGRISPLPEIVPALSKSRKGDARSLVSSGTPGSPGRLQENKKPHAERYFNHDSRRGALLPFVRTLHISRCIPYRLFYMHCVQGRAHPSKALRRRIHVI